MRNLTVNLVRNLFNWSKTTPQLTQVTKLLHQSSFLPKNVTCKSNLTFCTGGSLNLNNLAKRFSSGIQDNISALQLKKRLIRKKKLVEDEVVRPPGVYNVVAYATAEEYDLEQLVKGLKDLDLYEPNNIKNGDVVHAVAKIKVEEEPREIFFFREGSVVFWNVNELESGNVLKFLKRFESDGYAETLVFEESETMNYRQQELSKPTALAKDGDFLLSLNDNPELTLDKYTCSNAMSLSVKLGIWEASLEKYINTIEFVTEDLKKGQKIRMSQEEVLRKHGELFALRHLINLGSDLLDTPDFYWDNEQLEALYQQICNYFAITKRTKVMNEKINHCVELIELLSSHLSDKHHVRLEWMIIVLIMVEVGFEVIHYVDRYIA